MQLWARNLFRPIAAELELKLEDTHNKTIPKLGKPDLLVLHSASCLPLVDSALVVIELKKSGTPLWSNSNTGQLGQRLRGMMKTYGIAFGILTNGAEIIYVRASYNRENHLEVEKCGTANVAMGNVSSFFKLALEQRNVPKIPEGVKTFFKSTPDKTAKFYIQQLLGRGSSCEVWSIIHEISENNTQTVKYYGYVLNMADEKTIPHLKQNANVLQSLNRTFGTTLNHPLPFPQVHWQGAEENKYYMLSTPEGRRLEPRKRKISKEQIKDVLTALACLHDIGLVHRDVEARNIILGEDCRRFAILIDYSAVAKPKVAVPHAGCSLCVPPEILRARRDGILISPLFSHDLWSFIAVCSRLLLSEDELFECTANSSELEQYWTNVEQVCIVF